MYTPLHIDEAPEHFCETLKINVVNPVTSQLFAITSEAKELDDEKKDPYHSIMANLLWIVERSQPDLETAVSFL